MRMWLKIFVNDFANSRRTRFTKLGDFEPRSVQKLECEFAVASCETESGASMIVVQQSA